MLVGNWRGSKVIRKGIKPPTFSTIAAIVHVLCKIIFGNIFDLFWTRILFL
jgi:hypothetical protein